MHTRLSGTLALAAALVARGAPEPHTQTSATASGKTILPASWTWDIRTSKVGATPPGHLWWNMPGAGLVGPAQVLVTDQMFDNIDLAYLKRVAYSGKAIPQEKLTPGAIIAVRTLAGDHAKLRVVRYFHTKEDFPE